MRKIKKFRLVELVLAMAFVVCTAFGLMSAKPTKVSANENTATVESNLKIAEYAVRIKADESDSINEGLRIRATATNALYTDTINQANVETGVLIIPKAVLGDTELTVAVTAARKVGTTGTWYKKTGDTDKYHSLVTLYDIPRDYYGSAIASRAYIYNVTSGAYSYSEVVLDDELSMSGVAKTVYKDESSEFTAAQKEALKTNYLDRTVTIDGEESTVMYGEKLQSPASNYVAEFEIFNGYYNTANTQKWDFDTAVTRDLTLVTHNVKMANEDGSGIVIQNFDAYDSDVSKVYTYSNGWVSAGASWVTSHTDKAGRTENGIAKITKAAGAKSKSVKLNASITKADLQYTMGKEDQYWDNYEILVLFDTAADVSVSLGKDGSTITVPGKVWTTLVVPKANVGSTTFRNVLGSDSTSGQIAFSAKNMSEDEAVDIYIADARLTDGVAISYSKDGGSTTSTVPTQGEEWEIIRSYNGNTAEKNNESVTVGNASATRVKEYKISVTCNGESVTVTGNKFTPTESGTYVVSVTAVVNYTYAGPGWGIKTKEVTDTHEFVL